MLNMEESNGLIPLCMACRDGRLSLVHALIQHGANVRGSTNYSDTPVMEAARNDHWDVVKALVIEYDYDVNIRDSGGSSLLHIATAKGNKEAIEMLVNDCGMSVSLVDEGGNTPLHVASKEGFYDCIASLLQCNAPMHIRNKEGKAPKDLMPELS